MVRSMTGYGSYEKLSDQGSLRVRLRSLNRKGLDISIALPPCWSDFEGSVRDQLAGRLHRGSVALYVDFEKASGSPTAFDHARWRQLLLTVESLCLESGWSRQEVIAALAAGNLIGSKHLSGLAGGGLAGGAPDSEFLGDEVYLALLQDGVAKAMDQFEAFREKEGASLKKIMLDLLNDLESTLESIKAQLQGLVERHQAKLHERLQQLGVHQQGDPSRWHFELALLADRMDVTEEVDRLFLHIEHFRDLLGQVNQPVGRKLDFLTQEMMREINTLMNKSQDAQLTPIGIEFKGAIERLREQLQNVE